MSLDPFLSRSVPLGDRLAGVLKATEREALLCLTGFSEVSWGAWAYGAFEDLAAMGLIMSAVDKTPTALGRRVAECLL